jgi:hypothetical protein
VRVDPTFQRLVCIDLLGRTPLPEERRAWSQAELGAEPLLDELLSRREYWETWYENQLFFYLLLDNFRPATAALDELPQQLLEKRLGVREALRAILISSSFNARNPGPDTFVSTVLEQNLGITVQKQPALLEAGKKMYDGYRGKLLNAAGASQADVVRIVVEQDAFLAHYLAREHRAIFGLDLPKAELEAAVKRLAGAPLEYPRILREWLLSERYRERAQRRKTKSDHAFIRSLYVDVLGRVPTYEEHQRIRNAMQSFSDAAPLRSVISRMLLDSGKVMLPENAAADPQGFVRDSFQRFFGRAPSADEERSYVTALAQKQVSPALVWKALLTHPEYQTY